MKTKAKLRWSRLCQSRLVKWTLVSLALLNLALLAFSLSTPRATFKFKWLVNFSTNHITSNGQQQSERYSDKATTRSPLKFKEDADVDPKIDQCPDILAGMSRGRWVTRPLTTEEQTTIDQYLQTARLAFGIPPSFQRRDGRCGDVAYEKSPSSRTNLFKAICNPKGEHPCCYENKCTARTIEQCKCPNCYDERPAVQSEYATWKPENPACDVGTYDQKRACDVLRGAEVVFVGDSFVRHVFAALAVVLTGNALDGALKKNVSVAKSQPCLGWHQVTGLPCKDLLDEDRLLCDGTVQIRYKEVFPSKDLPVSVPFLKSLHQKKSLIVLGMGIHDDFQVKFVRKNFLIPFVNIHQWINRHPSKISEVAHGLLNYSAPLSHNKLYMNYDGRALDSMLRELGLNKTQIRDLSWEFWDHSSPSVNAKQDRSLVMSPTPVHALEVRSSPQLLWIGAHAPGVLKSHLFKRQTYEGVRFYNEKVSEFLRTWQVPYLDTIEFSKDAVSYDGTHYGWGINALKVNMILTFLDRWTQSGRWPL